MTSSSSPQQIALALTVFVAVAWAEMCSPPTIAIPAVQVQARYGQPSRMTAEYQGPPPLLIRWTRQIYNPDLNAYDEVPIVTYSLAQGNNSWAGSSAPRTYAAVYVYRQDSSSISYELQIRQASCESEGMYTCHFMTSVDCSISFNISLTAPPLAPLMRNTIIRADPGATVDIMCEANVGYPAVDILWYYVPADGSVIREITKGITTNTTSAGDCREFKTSTLRVTVNNEDHNGKFRCRTMDRFGGSGLDYFTDGRVAINGLEPTTPPYSTLCRGQNCAGRNGGSSAGKAVSAIVIHAWVLLFAIVVLCD